MEQTALMISINKGDFDKALELLNNGETIPDNIPEWDKSQLYRNIICGKAFEILDILVKQGKINTDIYEYTTFRNSIYDSLLKNIPSDEASINYLKTFIERSDNINDEVDGHTLLSYALEIKAQLSVVQALIDAGLRTDFKDNAENNLIHQVVSMNMIPKEKQIGYLEILFKEGIDANETNIVRENALHIAVESDKPDLFDLLLSHGISANEQDSQGNSPYFYALAHKLNGDYYKKMAAYEPADFSQTNKSGESMLTEFFRMTDASERDIELVERLIEDGADMETTAPYYEKQKSCWDWAIEKPLGLLQLMLRKTNRDINKQDDEGNTLLHKVCAINCNYEQEVAKEIYKKTKFLLEAGADITITNTQDKTPEMLASDDNLKIKTVELLLTAKK